jgi:hypothetical protein
MVGAKLDDRTLLALDHGVEFLRGAFLNVPGSIPLRVNLRSQRRRLRRELRLRINK